MKFELTGKTALVCGGSAGLGAASARKLSQMGVKVILLSRNQEKLNSALKTLTGSGHTSIALDLFNHDQLKTEIKNIIEKENGIDILINNAGGPKGGPIIEADIDEFKNGFHTHLIPAHLISQLVVPKMKEKKWGRIINIISSSVKTPLPGLGVSNTVRWSVAAWAKTLATELATFGITVNNVLPGAHNTERLTSLFKTKAAAQGISEAEVEKNWKSTIPVGEFGDADNFGAVVAFFASEEARYVTGTALQVDGGRTACL